MYCRQEKWCASVTNEGELENLKYGEVEIAFRHDSYAGPSFWIEEDGISKKLSFAKNRNLGYVSEQFGLYTTMDYAFTDQRFSIQIKVKNISEAPFSPQHFFMRLGLDTYMESFPQWNDIFFPSCLRCEKTHFWGYFMTPSGKILSVFSKNPVKSWKLNYNRLNPEHLGHRIYTADIELLSNLPQPERHPEGLCSLMPGEEMTWVFHFQLPEEVSQIPDMMDEIPFISAQRYTVYGNEPIQLKVSWKGKGHLELWDEQHTQKIYHGELAENVEKSIEIYLPLDGRYVAHYYTDTGLCATAYFYRRKEWSWYLQMARKAALEKPQKATTHLEPWYGFYSAFLAARYFPNSDFDNALESDFNKVLNQMYSVKEALPYTDPGRISNTAVAIGILCDAFEATGKPEYLDLASRLGDFLQISQYTDGSYRAYSGKLNFCYHNSPAIGEQSPGVHYTAVTYVAKSMMELALCEKREASRSPKYQELFAKHWNSAKQAIDDLVKRLDNIETEGEMTFEDGMISCSALQIAFYALFNQNVEEKNQESIAAMELLQKHQCLEQLLVPDCRCTGATIRFWEAQYDILLDSNMINSPHGWTSWKTYATWYLYLLTGLPKYLHQTMDTLGACMQMVDLADGDLNWAFIVDPCIETGVWVQDPENSGCGNRQRRIIGEQYMPMISGWWRSKGDAPVGAYLSMPLVTAEGIFGSDNQGGCCDNDVHEHFKCLAEVALLYAYVIVDSHGVENYNCTAVWENEVLTVHPYENCIKAVHINSISPCKVRVDFHGDIEEKDCSGMAWIPAKEYKDDITAGAAV